MLAPIRPLRSSSSKAPERLAALALGFAAGVASGVLLAPDVGRRSRQRLAEKAQETARIAQNRALSATQPIVDRVRGASHELAVRHLPLLGDWDVVDGRELLEDLSRPVKVYP